MNKTIKTAAKARAVHARLIAKIENAAGTEKKRLEDAAALLSPLRTMVKTSPSLQADIVALATA